MADRSAARLIEALGRQALPLAGADDLEPLLDHIGDARYVLLGEASHGTSEYYRWRTEISKRLIREKGFSFIAVEGDWPDCYRVHRYITSGEGTSPEEVLHAFARWPTWMWANREVQELVEFLHGHNRSRPRDDRVGFFGLDVYSLWESMTAVVEYLERIDPDAARSARGAYACFEPYHEDAQQYARATALVPTSCEEEAVAVLQALRARAGTAADPAADRDALFDAEQNGLIARNAELYYRTMVRGGPTSWNVRDHHMTDTLDRLTSHYGPQSKAIVWEHNTHIGDARFTNMASAGMVNVGQLVRQRHGEEGVVLVGFGSHRGSVIAGEEWGAPMRRMPVPEARRNSIEDLMHRACGADALFLFGGAAPEVPGLDETRVHRAIGVVYDPRAERWGNYVPTILPGRYDAFLFIDESQALSPMHMPVEVHAEAPETFPSGM